MKTICCALSLMFMKYWLYEVVTVLALVTALGCAGDFNLQYENSIAGQDYVTAKNLMRQQAKELSYRDKNATLQLRLAQTLYRMAYAHGKLGEYDSMKVALYSSANHDRSLAKHQERMTEYFANEEYNHAAAAYNGGDFEGSLQRLRVALSILSSEKTHGSCLIAILRGMSSAALAAGDMEEARESFRKGSDLGDSAAREMLTEFKRGETPKPLPRLEPRENPSIKIL